MYDFIFSIDGQVHFHCYLDSIQCIDTLKNGRQCKHKTVMGSPYCYSHLLYRHKLRIKPSDLQEAGLGLFAVNPMATGENEIVFKKGTTIIEYMGEIIDEEELVERYAAKTAPYTVKIKADTYEDAAKTRGVGALANTNPGRNNAKLSIHAGRARLKATQNIRNGDEIFLSYGRSYRLIEPGVEHSTRKVRK